jgi:hypothetical protein
MASGRPPFVTISCETGISTCGFQSFFADRINVMSLNRRQFLNLAPGGAAASLLVDGSTRADNPPTIKAIVFDAFTIFDAQPITSLAEELFTGRGTELSNLWRTRQMLRRFLASDSGRAGVRRENVKAGTNWRKTRMVDEQLS